MIRAYYRIATGTFREPLYADREEWHFIALRGLFGVPLIAATALYVLDLRWAPWSLVGQIIVPHIADNPDSCPLLSPYLSPGDPWHVAGSKSS